MWTILSPVKEANIYVQLKYLFLSEQTTLRIQNDRKTQTFDLAYWSTRVFKLGSVIAVVLKKKNDWSFEREVMFVARK